MRRAVRPCCRRDDGAKVNKKDSRTLKTKTTMEENSNMTAERSLEIIRESIERSQRTITRNSAVPLIWWGVCVVVFSFIIAYLWANHGGPAWNALWAVMWLFGYVGNRMIDKKKETVPTTFVALPSFTYTFHEPGATPLKEELVVESESIESFPERGSSIQTE